MLVSSLVTLRQPLEKDIELLMSMRNNVDLQAMLMALPKANNIQRVQEWLSRHLNDRQTIFFIIAEKITDRICGYIQLVNIDFIHRFGELGICLSPLEQGKGYGKDAMQVFEKYLCNTFNLRKIMLKVLASNKTAICFYQKLGYLEVGIYREHFYHGSLFHDVILMEKLLSSQHHKS
jgi:diamine N-acetyltransferase